MSLRAELDRRARRLRVCDSEKTVTLWPLALAGRAGLSDRFLSLQADPPFASLSFSLAIDPSAAFASPLSLRRFRFTNSRFTFSLRHPQCPHLPAPPTAAQSASPSGNRPPACVARQLRSCARWRPTQPSTPSACNSSCCRASPDCARSFRAASGRKASARAPSRSPSTTTTRSTCPRTPAGGDLRGELPRCPACTRTTSRATVS